MDFFEEMGRREGDGAYTLHHYLIFLMTHRMAGTALTSAFGFHGLVQLECVWIMYVARTQKQFCFCLMHGIAFTVNTLLATHALNKPQWCYLNEIT